MEGLSFDKIISKSLALILHRQTDRLSDLKGKVLKLNARACENTPFLSVRYWNNKGRITLYILLFALCSMLFALCLILPDRANSGPYLDSAHANSTYAVKRTATGFPIDYARGNCAHCHEQHASIGGSEPAPTGGPSKYDLLANNFSGKTTNLYSQSDDVCFYCHVDTVTGTYQTPSFNNYTYSATFGGCSTATDCTTGTIFEAFNSPSYHNLNDVLNFAKNTWSSTFTANSNPCSACHNVHKAKRSCNKPPLTNSYDPTNSAISKPSDHNNLWGDDTSERMNPNFTTSYQAPYWYGSTTAYEPANNTTYDGTNLPDYVTFCTNCHNATNTIYSTTLGRDLKKIDWETIGGDSITAEDKHGKNSATTDICINPPYNSTTSCTTSGLGKVLSCLDCHEPHGAPNNFLIRKEVNGDVLSGTVSTGTKDYGYLCRRCHTDDLAYNPTYGLANYWEAVHHCAGDYPYNQSSCTNIGCHSSGGSANRRLCGGVGGTPPPAIPCSNCHYHGSSVTNADYTPTTRRTF